MQTMINISYLGLVVVLAAACAGVDIDDIRAHEQAWQDRHISTYVFVYREFCFCDPHEEAGNRVLVQDGRAQSAVGVHSGLPYPDAALTIDDLFDRVLESVQSEPHPDEFSIHYDPKRGFIDKFDIDPDDDTEDDSYGLEVACFSKDPAGCPVRVFTPEQCKAQHGEVTQLLEKSPEYSCQSPFTTIVAQVEPGVSVCCTGDA